MELGGYFTTSRTLPDVWRTENGEQSSIILLLICLIQSLLSPFLFLLEQRISCIPLFIMSKKEEYNRIRVVIQRKKID